MVRYNDLSGRVSILCKKNPGELHRMTPEEYLEAYNSIANLSIESKKVLVSYLADHEDDMALEINDFGMLAPLFYELVGRPAEKRLR